MYIYICHTIAHASLLMKASAAVTVVAHSGILSLSILRVYCSQKTTRPKGPSNEKDTAARKHCSYFLNRSTGSSRDSLLLPQNNGIMWRRQHVYDWVLVNKHASLA